MNLPDAVNEVEVDASFDDEDVAEPISPEDIVAYNELRSCADLVRMYANGKLEIQPDFQRDFVWKQQNQTRFIDSLVKQLPIPSMCFSLDYKTGHWKVIDGLQRMSTIIRFLGSDEWRLSDLPEIHPRLRHATNLELASGDSEQSKIFSRVEDVSLPVTVIRCDYSKQDHMRYLFTIFHRLNSGGVRLNNQEIRNCIYNGSFNDTLKEFDGNNEDWIIVKSKIWGAVDRFRSVEVLLRMLAFGEQLDRYDGKLARFLNDYMHSQTINNGLDLSNLKQLLDIVSEKARMLLEADNRKTPLVIVESLLVALYRINGRLAGIPDQDLKDAYNRLKNLPVFKEERARYGVSSIENVNNRLGSAIAEMSF
jgi:hypothetical protein